MNYAKTVHKNRCSAIVEENMAKQRYEIYKEGAEREENDMKNCLSLGLLLLPFFLQKRKQKVK